jgi:hypothetical protein
MKKALVLLCILGISACASDKGLLELKQMDSVPEKVVILKDQPTRELVLPILVEWFAENNHDATVVESINEIKPNDYVLSYRAWWGWDLSTYMRKANMKVKLDNETLAKLRFSALEYGGFGKFGDTEKRLKILLDVLFGKITREEADKRLGEQ